MRVCVCLSADTPAAAAAAAADAVTSRAMTRCSCDVGCPCCGRCIETSSQSSSSWPPLPASSVAALRDVDVFIARYRVSPPPPLIQSPPAPSSDPTTWMFPVLTTAQMESSASTLSCRNTLLEDSREPRGPLADTAAQLVDYQSNVTSCGTLRLQNNESISETNWSWSSTGSALDLTACSVFSNINPDAQVYNNAIPVVTAAGIYSNASLEQPPAYSLSSQDLYSQPSVPCVSTVYSWNIDRQSLDEPGSTVASEVGSNGVSSFSTIVSESGLQPTDHTFYNCSTEVVGKVSDSVSTHPPRSSVITLAQQADKYWAQRGDIFGASQSTIQHDKAPVVRELSRPTAPPPAPPGLLTSTNAYVDRPAADCTDPLMVQTLPRAASTRSLQAPPPRPPPRSTTQESNDTSALLGRSLPPEPDLQTTFDRISLCQGQMTTFQSPRMLRDSGSLSGLSGSVQSLPGCDVTASSLVAGATTSRGRPAPQPPRRGSSMSPRLQTKSTRHGHRARSASLRFSDEDADSDMLLRLGGNSASTSATVTRQQLDASRPNQSTVNIGERETARKATVSGQKPVAQIRPHAIRSPSASSYTRQRIDDDGDNKCSTEARTSVVQQSFVQTRATDDCSDTQSFSFTSVGVSSERQGGTASNMSFSRFGTLRSRIRDYVTAAASVGANRKQQTTSSSFADWTLPRSRRPDVARRSSSATSWEPDRSDYASSGSEQSRGTAALDDSAVWSSSSYFGVFPGPRPFSSPRTRATEVSLPQNIIASADSAMSAADVTSSITSRISTFLTFLGGSRRPPDSSDTPLSTSSATPPQPGSTTVSSSTRIERPRNSASYTKIPTAKAVVDPIVSTLDRQSRAMSSSPPVRSASTSEVLAKAAAAAAAAARDARGRQPMRFVREQRTSMSTFRSSGSLVVSVGRSSSFSPHSTSAAREAQQSADGSQVSDGRRTSKSGTLDDGAGQVSSPAQSSTKHSPSVARYAHQSAPSTPLDWNDEDRTQQTMTSSLPFDNSIVQPPQIGQTANSGESPATMKEAHEVPQSTCSSTVPLSVFRQVDVEVERLIELLQNAAVADNPPSWRDADGSGRQVEAARESLLALTRQFVDDSQRLVSGATRSVNALVVGVEPSLATLTRLTGECQSTAALLTSPSQGVMLVGRVRDLAQAYRSTVSAARSAVGRPFNSVEMKSLMRQATSLAAILSSLIKMLNRTDIIC